MPNETLTEIAVVLDRSGSMSGIAADMIGGFAHFIGEQKKAPGEAVVSVYRFDSVFEVAFEEVALDQVEPLVLEPRGSTALLDAMGMAVRLIGARLKAKPDRERPGSVVVMVITDGAENASQEFTRDTVQKMVEHQRAKYDWQFAFLGANIDSFAEARSLGVSGSSVMNYQASAAGVRGMQVNSAKAVSKYRADKFAMVEQGVVGAGLRSAKLDLSGSKGKKDETP